MSEQEGSVTDISHLQAFRMLVLRVIELYVRKNIGDDVNIDKMTELINTNPLAGLVRRMIQDRTPDIDCISPVTRREVILAVTRFLKSAEIKIHSTGSPDFNVLLTRTEFNDLIASVYSEYQQDVLREIREDEEEFKRKLSEIALIEKGELDNVIISEFNKKKLTEPETTGPKQQEKTSIPLLPSTQTQSNPSFTLPPSSAPVANSTDPVIDTQETVDAPTSADIGITPSHPLVPQTQTQEPVKLDKTEDVVMDDAVPSEEPSDEKKNHESQQEMTDKEATVDLTPILEPTKSQIIKQEVIQGEANNLDEPNTDISEEKTLIGKDETQTEAHGHEDDQTESEHSDSKQENETDAIKEDTEKKAEDEEDEEEDEDEDEDEEEEEEEGESRKRANEDDDTLSLPAKKKAKTNSSSSAGLVPNRKLQVIAKPLLAQIASYKYASTFLQPVQPSNAPEYYSLIKEPHDLKTMKAMVKDGRIQTRDELERAILLMFANAIMYNKSDSDISSWTREMQLAVDDMIKMFKEVEDKK